MLCDVRGMGLLLAYWGLDDWTHGHPEITMPQMPEKARQFTNQLKAVLSAPSIKPILRSSQLAFRAAVAATVSYGLAKMFTLEHPIYALISAIIVTDFSPAETTKLGLQRLAGTVIGAACGMTIWAVFKPVGWAVGLGILAAMVVCHIFKVSAGAKVAGYISALVMLNYGENPWSFASNRLMETALGIGIAWLVSLVPRLIQIEEPSATDPDKPA